MMAPGAALVSASPASPISVQNIDSPDPVVSGDQLTYTITVVNTGGARATEVAFTSQYNGLAGLGTPPQLVLSSTLGSCTQTQYQVNCNTAVIQGGQTWTITVRGIVTAAAGTTLNNIANVTGTRSAQTFNTSATASTLVIGPGPGGPAPDLSVTKTGPSSAVVGSDMTYTLTVNNTGTANATDIMVVDTLPSGMGFISASGTSLFVCTADALAIITVTCTGGRVNAGANATITINATAPAATGTIANTASVDPEDTIAETNEFNNASAQISTTILAEPLPAGLAITKTDSPDPVTPGGELTYEVTVTNISGYRADYLTLTDGTQGLEAASLSIVSVTSDGTTPECVIEAPKVTCTTTRLPAGGIFYLKISGFVVASAGSTLLNTATIDGNIRNTGVTNSATARTTVKPAIDLSITKADNGPVCAGTWPDLVPPPGVCTGGLIYTFVVGNGGIEDATNVRVRDQLADGVIFDSFTQFPLTAGFTCTVNTQNVLNCTGGTVLAESTVTLTIVLVAPQATGSITNTVTVDPANAIFESDETNNVATITTQIKTGIDLTILKTDSPPGFDPIATSGTQTYTITVDNIGTQDATNIRVRDTLPADSTFRDVTADNGFTCSHSGGIVECVGGSLLGTLSEFYLDPPPGPDDTAVITIRIFAQPYVGVMHNEVRVDPLGEIAEADETNNIDIEDTVVTSGGGTIGAFNELEIDKSDTPDPVSTSSIVTYSIVVTNTGTDPAVNVTVRDFLPSGFVYIEAVDSTPGPVDFFCSLSGSSTVNCTGATLDGTSDLLPAVPVSRTIIVKAFSSAVPGTYTNQALVDPDEQIDEGNENNNNTFETTTVTIFQPGEYIDLTISKDDSPDPVTPRGVITYTLTVTNDGTNPAFGVEVRDTLPADTTFISATDATASPGDFICTHSGGVVTCTGGILDGSLDLLNDPLTPGDDLPQTRLITIRVRAPAVDDFTITNQAFVDPDNDIPEANETNNSDSEETGVESRVNLTIEKDGPKTAQQSNEETYTITVTNEGEDAAFGVGVHDALPVGMIVLNATADNNFICQVLENPVNVVDCEGDLDGSDDELADPIGSTVTITIDVFITAEDGTLDNEACVDPDNEIVEDSEVDNCSTATTEIGVPDLSLNKNDEPDTVTLGADLIYTITVSNVGDATAAVADGTITVTDDLPAGLDFVSANATNGFTCTEAATVVTCEKTGDLTAGDSTIITITTTVTTSVGPISNTATVETATDEANTTNNSDTESTNIGGPAVDLVLGSGPYDAPDPAPHGDSVTYTVVVTNGGTADVTGVKVRNVFSSTTGLTLVSATASQGFACGLSGVTIDCDGDLDAGSSTTVEIVWQTSSAAPTSITNTITVDPLDTIPESDETNNGPVDEVTTISGAICSSCVDLVTTNIVESADPVDASDGDTLTYIVTVGNVGDQSTDTTGSDDVLIWFDLGWIPDGTADINIGTLTGTAGFTCSQFVVDSGTIWGECTGELGPGQGTILTATLTVGPTSGSTNARVEADPLDAIAEFLESNNVDSESTTVDP